MPRPPSLLSRVSVVSAAIGALAVVALPSMSQAQAQPIQPGSPISPAQRDEAFRQAREAEERRLEEQERQRLEEVNRQAEIERARTRLHSLSCRVSQVNVTAEFVGVSCLETWNTFVDNPRMTPVGDGVQFLVYINDDPELAVAVASVAAAAHLANRRVFIEAATRPPETRPRLTRISVRDGV